MGTRGDIEPFLAVGEILKNKGHEIICAFEDQFESLVIESQFEFISIDRDILNPLTEERFNLVLEKKISLWKIAKYRKVFLDSLVFSRELVDRQSEIVAKVKPDKIIYNGLTNYPVIWSIENPNKAILLLPIPYLYHYVKDHSFLLFNKDYGPVKNKWTYQLAHYMISKGIALVARKSNIDEEISFSKIRKVIKQNKTLYSISRVVFPQPEYWDDHSKVLGFHHRSLASYWEPDQEVLDFLAKHDKIVFVTFGSMTNNNPDGITRIFLDIFKKHQIPAIFNTSSGGLVTPTEYDQASFLFTHFIPYDWILRRVYCVIHHGGSGTTHYGLKSGCPTMIVPHIFDQFAWNRLICSHGLGPKGPSINRFKRKNAEPKILDLYNNVGYKEKADKVALEMNNEDLKKDLYQFIIE